MKILTVPQDTAMLRTKSSSIQEVTPEVIKFLRELGDTLKNQHNPQGVGLSAIQVGRPIRAFATWLPREGPRDKGLRLRGSGVRPENSAPRDSRSQGIKGEKNDSRFTNNELRFYINPEILDHSKELTLGEDLVRENRKHSSSLQPSSFSPRPFLEGCLSIPSVYGPVPRWMWIKASAVVLSESDVSSSRFPASPAGGPLHAPRFTLEKLAARVFQHELDHLNGILFTDRTLDAGLGLYRQKEKELVEMEM